MILSLSRARTKVHDIAVGLNIPYVDLVQMVKKEHLREMVHADTTSWFVKESVIYRAHPVKSRADWCLTKWEGDGDVQSQIKRRSPIPSILEEP